MERVLCLDYGEARIGIAVSDSIGLLAHPRPFISRNDPDLFQTIQRLMEEDGCSKLIMGLPLTMEGKAEIQAQKVITFAEEMKKAIGKEITLVDERLSTAEAHGMLSQKNIKGKKKMTKVDSISAAIILQRYLDEHRNK